MATATHMAKTPNDKIEALCGKPFGARFSVTGDAAQVTCGKCLALMPGPWSAVDTGLTITCNGCGAVGDVLACRHITCSCGSFVATIGGKSNTATAAGPRPGAGVFLYGVTAVHGLPLKYSVPSAKGG